MGFNVRFVLMGGKCQTSAQNIAHHGWVVVVIVGNGRNVKCLS